MQDWIEAETKGADFGDKRLNKRFALLLDRLSDKPSLSIPAACKNLAETTAAYRFFDNDKTDAAKVLKPHQDATVQRIRAHDVVIVAQDTTEIDLITPARMIINIMFCKRQQKLRIQRDLLIIIRAGVIPVKQ